MAVTPKGISRVYPLVAATNLTIVTANEFDAYNSAGIKFNIHSGFWFINLSATAADIAWLRMDGTAATVEGDDCIPLRAQERVILRPADSFSMISAGTPKIAVVGDCGAIVYS